MTQFESFVDNKLKLESFVNISGAKPGIKFFGVGIGQGGNKMVDAFASIRKPGTQESIYPTLAINSNVGDMQKLANVASKDQLLLKGYERGVGKNPDVGKLAFTENGEEIFEAVVERMGDCDIILLFVASGGGTGTGAMNEFVDTLSRYSGKPITVITSLPIPNETETINAFNALQELTPKLKQLKTDDDGFEYRVLESLILMDNQKIVKEHLISPEVQGVSWDYYSNYKLAAILHEWSILTGMAGDYTVDATDVLNHLLLGGNIITFAKKKIPLEEYKNQEDLINQIVTTYSENNVLANGFDYDVDLRSMAMVVVMPQKFENYMNHDILEKIREGITKTLPHVNFFPGSVTYTNKKYAIVYTMGSMAGLPERAKNLRTEAEELVQKRIEKEQKASGFSMGEKLSLESSTGNMNIRGRQPKLPGQPQIVSDEKQIPIVEEQKIKKIVNPYKK